MRGYLDNINCQYEREIPIFGQAIGHIFSPLRDDLSAVDLVESRASRLSNYIEGFSKLAVHSLQSVTKSILEIYKEPDSWSHQINT